MRPSSFQNCLVEMQTLLHLKNPLDTGYTLGFHPRLWPIEYLYPLCPELIIFAFRGLPVSRDGNDNGDIEDLTQQNPHESINIPGLKAYEEYKDDWIYEWNDGITWLNEKPWTEDGEWTKAMGNIHHECNPLRFKNRTAKWPTFMDHCKTQKEQGWFDEHELMGDDDNDIGYLEDYLIRKDPPYYVNEDEEKFKEQRCKLLGIPCVKLPTCKTKKFEVAKYLFGPAEEYVAITEYEYDI
ncbi:hypothetical protein Tco_0291119 [Tanacetum coccineum]